MDYYKIDLQAGFTYTINARIHDSYNSGNGQSYTGDVTFSYKSGSTWSDAYDDIMPSDILLQNGGTLIFNVTPYFLNATGTYLLDMNIFRNPLGIESSTEKNHLQVFPNPAQDIVTFQVDLKIPGTIMGTLNNVYGQQVMEIVNGTYSAGLNNINIDVSQLAPGYYIYQIKTSAEKATGKLSIVR